MLSVDELVANGGHLGEEAEPAERIDPLEGFDRLRGDCLARGPVEAVAPDDEVGVQAVGLPALLVGDPRLRPPEVARRDVRGVVDRRRSVCLALVHEVARHLGLAVDRHPLAAGEALEVDVMQRPVQRDVEAVVGQPLGVEPLGCVRLAHHLDHALLEHAGADPTEDIVPVDPVEDDVVDAGERQQPAEQQAGGAGADDGDLGAHGCPPVEVKLLENRLVGRLRGKALKRRCFSRLESGWKVAGIRLATF